MANYDYEKGKKRIEDILNNKLDVVEQNEVPSEEKFTFDNGYYSWVTAVFVDIRNSTDLFSNSNKENVSKIIRCFTSEIIEILREGTNLREIGIRGDCVYAIYSAPSKTDELEIADKVFYINTFMKMLNKLLSRKNLSTLKVGIGMSTAQELVVKAGRKGTGINNNVWIGEAVTKASNLSSIANKVNYRPIAVSKLSYDNFIEELEKDNSKAKSWFTKEYDDTVGTYYSANIIKTSFDKWVDNL